MSKARHIAVTLFQYEWPHSFKATRTVQRRTRFGAIVAAKKILRSHEVETTRDPYCYHRDAARGAYCVVQRGGRKATFVKAAVRLVPSVADLGWTP